VIVDRAASPATTMGFGGGGCWPDPGSDGMIFLSGYQQERGEESKLGNSNGWFRSHLNKMTSGCFAQLETYNTYARGHYHGTSFPPVVSGEAGRWIPYRRAHVGIGCADLGKQAERGRWSVGLACRMSTVRTGDGHAQHTLGHRWARLCS
jgi:hypothetical protein